MEAAELLWTTHPDAVILEEIFYANGKHVALVRERHGKIIQEFIL